VESLIVHYDTTVDSVVSGKSVVDTSGNGINATLYNGASYSSSDRALTFDGTNDYVVGTLNNPAGDWVHSFSFWMKLNVDQSTIGNARVDPVQIGSTGATSKYSAIDVHGTQINWYFYSNDVSFPISGIKAGEWNHLTFAYEGGGTNSYRHAYLNGTEVTMTSSLSGGSALNIDGNATFTLGADSIRAGAYLNGSISNFKVWSGVALTADEIRAEYALGRTSKTLNITDTAVCIGGVAPRAQLDVRGSARFDGHLNVSSGNNSSSPASTINGWKTLTWSGGLVGNGTTSVAIFDRSGRGSGNGGEIAGEVTVVCHRDGVNQTRAYAKYHVNYTHWYGTTFYGENNEYSNYNNNGISNIQISPNAGAGTVSVSISTTTGTTGQYYIKFDGPVYLP
jgi:hypothetical protein